MMLSVKTWRYGNNVNTFYLLTSGQNNVAIYGSFMKLNLQINIYNLDLIFILDTKYINTKSVLATKMEQIIELWD